jgi:REP-associated tyrosine transposase
MVHGRFRSSGRDDFAIHQCVVELNLIQNTVLRAGMPKFDLQKHHRRSIRLKGFDYSSAGAYFVTIVTWHREMLFGDVANREMKVNQRGKIAHECWRLIPEHFQHVELGTYIVMPNHVHGIIIINDIDENRIATNSSQSVGARHASPLRPRGTSPGSLGTIVGSFKSSVTRQIGRELNETGIWQRSYYEHVIRNEKDLQNTTNYIESNLLLWNEDDENPANTIKKSRT